MMRSVSSASLIGIVQRVDLHTVFFTRCDPMFQQRHLVAAFAFRRKQHGVADTEISNAAVSQFIKIIGGFFSGKGIVVVNVDGLVGGLHCFADNDMKQTLISQIGCYRTVFFRIEQDKAIFLGNWIPCSVSHPALLHHPAR